MIKDFPWQQAMNQSAGVQWRQSHWENFLRQGLPTRKLESWHYTDLRKWLEGCNRLASASSQTPLVAPLPTDDYRIVFVNGTYIAKQSRVPEGVSFSTWSTGDVLKPQTFEDYSAEFESLEPELGGLVELQQALVGEGYILHFGKNVKIPEPIHVVYQWSDQVQKSLATHSNWIHLEEGAEASIVEWYRGSQNLVSSNWTVVDQEPKSTLELIRVQSHAATAVNLGVLAGMLAEDAQFSGFLLDRGGSLSRETWAISHVGERAISGLSALQLGDDQSHMDLRTVTRHDKVRGQSSQRARSILAGKSHTVFNGKVVIAKDAQEVAAAQLSQSILLSDTAEANAKPELEIYADNVKASHGASVGKLNEEELFFLRSRGLSLRDSQRILAEGFARDMVRDIRNPRLRRQMESWIQVQVDTVLAQGELT